MIERHHKIIFDSRTIPESEISEVKGKLSALLNLEGERLARLFSGRPVVIRTDVDHPTALKYKVAFERTGAKCQLVDIEEESPGSAITEKSVQKTEEHKKIVCPHCHFEQGQSEECIRCGIIISKYHEKKEQTGPQHEEPFFGQTTGARKIELKVTGEFSKKTALGHKWLLHRILPKKMEYLFRNIFTRKNRYFRYIARVLDTLIHAILLVATTAILSITLMYVGEMVWHFYASTPVGEKFIQMNAAKVQTILAVLDRDFIFFSIQLTLSAFAICMAISAVCQVLHIARYFYLPRGFFGKLGIWGLPLTALVAIYIQPMTGLQQFALVYAIALVPTLCLFSGCFKVTYEVLPEIGDLLSRALQLRRKSSQTMLPG